jgi:hypothetical protein
LGSIPYFSALKRKRLADFYATFKGWIPFSIKEIILDAAISIDDSGIVGKCG